MRREVYSTEATRIVTLSDPARGVSVIVVDELNATSRTVEIPWAAIEDVARDLELRRIEARRLGDWRPSRGFFPRRGFHGGLTEAAPRPSPRAVDLSGRNP